ncbi:hypothetical protein ACS5PU_08240 [Pedobacter sp. GSP4]|uniref:hypothetical protein n=1 Tax=Pedobacter sp. GSP4 TaxID=3453716 RepID=UPI003EEF8C85
MSNLPAIWSGSDELIISTNLNSISQIVPLASGLTVKQQSQIISAFNDLQAYDMAVEFAWRKTTSRLKETLASLGMQFIGEMLGRDDISDSTPYETVLTDYQAIQLSEQLGLISSSASLNLRQSLELISHYASNKASEEIDAISAMNIIKNSIKYVLGHQDMVIAMEFTNFRDRLLTENIKPNDPVIDMLMNSPLFYARTVSFILLNAIRKDEGAKIEHALANYNVILPKIWDKFNENDKWSVGFAYRDVVSDNNMTASNGLKQALMKVGGFDFVPESLRSATFIKASRNVVEVHYAFNNFYNEPAAVRALADLGTTIPKPAFLACMQAYLLVCIGNFYGTSAHAVEIAEQQLSQVPEDRWKFYFEKGLNIDKEVLANLRTNSQVRRFSRLLRQLGMDKFDKLPKDNQKLYNSIVAEKDSALWLSEGMYKSLKN